MQFKFLQYGNRLQTIVEHSIRDTMPGFDVLDLLRTQVRKVPS